MFSSVCIKSNSQNREFHLSPAEGRNQRVLTMFLSLFYRLCLTFSRRDGGELQRKPPVLV